MPLILSVSDLLHELEDAAAVPVEDDDVEQEEDDIYEDRHPISDIVLTHVRSISSLREDSGNVTAELSNATYANDPDTTISSNRPSSSLLTQRKVTPSSHPQSTLSENDGSGISRMSQVSISALLT